MLRYAITTGELRAGDEKAAGDLLITRCAQLARAGVAILLVREKRLEAGALAATARRVADAVRGSGTRVLVAGRVDVALAAGAVGVSLPASDGELTVAQVRRVMPAAWVSVSCHTVEQVRRAREEGADGVLFAPVFGKRVDGVQVVAAAGLDRLREACEAAGEVPVFALGGVTEGNAAECVAAGASGVAGIRMFFGGPD